MRRALAIFALMTLASCGVVAEATDDLAREQAKQAVNQVVANRFPGANPAPVADCIIDAADAGEILGLAGASVTGVTQSTIETVVNIASRPDAVRCLARNSLSMF